MDVNENLSEQFDLLLNQSNCQQQTNLCSLYNPNITTADTNCLPNMFASNPQYLYSFSPMNIGLNPTTDNSYHVFMPPKALILPCNNTNDNDLHVFLQEPKKYFGAGDVIPVDPNWDAINAFLAGHVRRGADVARVYHCTICDVEFANPQALGGHMSSHTRGRKIKEHLRTIKPRKFKNGATKKLQKCKAIVKNSSF